MIKGEVRGRADRERRLGKEVEKGKDRRTKVIQKVVKQEDEEGKRAKVDDVQSFNIK